MPCVSLHNVLVATRYIGDPNAVKSLLHHAHRQQPTRSGTDPLTSGSTDLPPSSGYISADSHVWPAVDPQALPKRHFPRHLNFILQFITDLQHMQGSVNAADASTMDDDSPAVDFRTRALATVDDPDFTRLWSNSSLHLEEVTLALSDDVICDVSIGVQQSCIPGCFLRAIFNSLPSTSHPGIQVSQCCVTSHFVWPHIDSDVQRCAPSCLRCQHAKLYCHTTVPLATFAALDPLAHVDLISSTDHSAQLARPNSQLTQPNNHPGHPTGHHRTNHPHPLGTRSQKDHPFPIKYHTLHPQFSSPCRPLVLALATSSRCRWRGSNVVDSN